MAKTSQTIQNPDSNSTNPLFLLTVIGLIVVGLGAVAFVATNRDSSSEAVVEPADGAETAAVEITGDALVALPRGVQVSDASTDPSFGDVAPTITGTGFDGSEVVIGPNGSAKAVYFLAHWCQHCQREVPMVQGLIDDGKQPEGLEIYAVSTAVDEGNGNFPPSAWLQREGFSSPVVRDDDTQTAMSALGGSSFPFVVYLDADNRVVARSAGSLDAATTEQLWGVAVGA